jgi:phosphate-selective porin OprO/OprP
VRILLGSLLLLPAVAAAQPTPDPTAPSEPPPVAAPPAEVAPPPAPLYDDAKVNALIDARLAAQKPVAGWKDGFIIQTADGKTKLKVGAILQFDNRTFIEDSAGTHTDQFSFRSIRPDLQATLFDHFDLRLMPDFAGGKLVVQDAYTDVRYSDVVKVRFGKFKVPFGLERLQGETNTLFAERGLPTQLAPNRDLGVQVFGEIAKGTLAYQVGVFNGVADGASGDGDVSDGKEGAARIFVKPFAQSGNHLLAELGAGGAVTYGQKNGTLASPDVSIFKTQASTTFFSLATGTTLADTVVADGHHWRATGQASYYAGPVGLLGEYVRSAEKIALGGDGETLTTESWQAVAQYVLTGDAATYKSVAPDHPLDPDKGQWGAFDVAARIGELRIVDTDIFRDKFADLTKSATRVWSAGIGLNWYANKNFRIAIDYERTWFRRGAKDGTTAVDRPDESGFVGRVQTAF